MILEDKGDFVILGKRQQLVDSRSNPLDACLYVYPGYSLSRSFLICKLLGADTDFNDFFGNL